MSEFIEDLFEDVVNDMKAKDLQVLQELEDQIRELKSIYERRTFDRIGDHLCEIIEMAEEEFKQDQEQYFNDYGEHYGH